MLKYDKMFKRLEEAGYSSYRIRKENIFGQRTYTALKNGTGGLNHMSINKVCALLDCQPGDIIEYVPDPEAPEEQ